MSILVTGAAGFIGFHVTNALLANGYDVIGIDNINDYYDPRLKLARLEQLQNNSRFQFYQTDITDAAALGSLAGVHNDIETVIHLAAQAGVRYSLKAPIAYIRSNVEGQTQILEWCRNLSSLRHLVYASSSSVYGANVKIPFAEDDPVTAPVSLYAATKRSAELITESYSRMYGLYCTGLRFFTVYGPYGRPDMAYYSFTQAIAAGEPITLYGDGKLKRDFTFVDDIVRGILAAMARKSEQKHRIYNLGNNKPELVTDLVAAIEKLLGRKAQIRFAPIPPGDVMATWADLNRSQQELGFEPTTSLTEGMDQFIGWYKEFYGAQ